MSGLDELETRPRPSVFEIDAFEEAKLLRARLVAANLTVGGLVYLCKQAYEERRDPNDDLSRSLYDTIKQLDPRWQPEPR